MSWERTSVRDHRQPCSTLPTPRSRFDELFPQPAPLPLPQEHHPPRWVQKATAEDKQATDQVSLLTTKRLIHQSLLPFQSLSK